MFSSGTVSFYSHVICLKVTTWKYIIHTKTLLHVLLLILFNFAHKNFKSIKFNQLYLNIKRNVCWFNIKSIEIYLFINNHNNIDIKIQFWMIYMSQKDYFTIIIHHYKSMFDVTQYFPFKDVIKNITIANSTNKVFSGSFEFYTLTYQIFQENLIRILFLVHKRLSKKSYNPQSLSSLFDKCVQYFKTKLWKKKVYKATSIIFLFTWFSCNIHLWVKITFKSANIFERNSFSLFFHVAFKLQT